MSEYKSFFERPALPIEWALLVMILLVVIFVLFPITGEKTTPHNISSLTNVKQLVLGTIMYSADSDDHFPNASEWMDEISPYVKSYGVFYDTTLDVERGDNFQEKLASKKGDYGYAFFEPLSRVVAVEILDPFETPVLFQSSFLYWNAASELWSLPEVPRANGKHIVGFCDGHAEFVEDDFRETQVTLLSLKSE